MKRLLLLAIVALALPTPAHAAFPGQNGKIAFVDYWDRISTVYPNGTGTAHLASTGVFSSSPHWSADGSKLVFAAQQDHEGPAGTYMVNSDGTGLHLVRLYASDPAWTANGRILFIDGRIWTMNPDGTGSTFIPNTSSSDLGPAGSPDGSKIAFERRPIYPNSDIYSINPDGTGLTNLTNNGAVLNADPEWSPDGSKIAFSRQVFAPGPTNSVWVMNSDGSGQTQLTSSGSGAAWSPDGSKIAYADNDGYIHLMNANGTGDTRLVRPAGGKLDWQPCASPCPPPLPPPYDVPAQAFSLDMPLVPNFRQTISQSQCQARGGTPSAHGAPLSFASCDPPGYVPGTAARLGFSSSKVRLMGQWDANLRFEASLFRVRAAAGGPYNPNSAGPDITIVVKLRITDTYNGSALGDPATVADGDFSVPVACVPNLSDSSSSCIVSTSANTVMPGVVKPGKSTVLQTFRVRVNDAGANGTRGDADDRTFATQGIYVP